MAEMVCRSCGSVGKPKSVTKGSFIAELFLWLCFLLPGALYTVWRLTTRHKACRACGGSEIIPAESPLGKELVAKFQK